MTDSANSSRDTGDDLLGHKPSSAAESVTPPTPERPTTMGEEPMSEDTVRALLPEIRQYGEPQDSTISMVSIVEFLLAEIDRLRAAALRSGRAET